MVESVGICMQTVIFFETLGNYIEANSCDPDNINFFWHFDGIYLF